jgi:hypothetical protein
VVVASVTTKVKVAHVRLCHSRMMFVRAYPRESQEIVFDAHDRAFAFFKGAWERGIYDNMKTVVDAVFVGKARAYNRRFTQMCGHYLVEPVACTPASGWEMFEAERPSLVPYAGPFDGFHAIPASVSKTCLVRFDNNKYSVAAGAVGRPVEIRAYTERIEIRQDGRIVGLHERAFGRGKTVYDPWHYVPVLARKPGALRNGVPFRDWVLPTSLERIRRKLRAVPDGDRQMVEVLTAVLSDGLEAVEAACREALDQVGPQAPPTRSPPSARLISAAARARGPPMDYRDELPSVSRRSRLRDDWGATFNAD